MKDIRVSGNQGAGHQSIRIPGEANIDLIPW